MQKRELPEATIYWHGGPSYRWLALAATALCVYGHAACSNAKACIPTIDETPELVMPAIEGTWVQIAENRLQEMPLVIQVTDVPATPAKAPDMPTMKMPAGVPEAHVSGGKLASAKFSDAQMAAMKEWTSALAIQAGTWGAPLVTMASLRYKDALSPQPKAQPNAIWRMEDISTPALSKEAGYVTPNVNTIYGFGFMDLRDEPIILEVPDSHGLYYMVEIVDMWTNAFAYAGGQSTGYKGGKFALVAPEWKGTLPAGVTRVDCPTPWVLLQPRVHIYIDGKVELTHAQEVLRQITTKGLSEFMGQPAPARRKTKVIAPDPIDSNLPVSAVAFKDPLQFWDILVETMTENPPPKAQIDALLPLFRPLGLEIGKPWDPSHLPPETVEIMKSVAAKIGSLLGNLVIGNVDQGALIPPPSIGNFGTDYLTRAVVGRLGLTANTPSEAVYWLYDLDQLGNPLMGNKKYKMTFKQDLAFFPPGFWSITMYDAQNNYTVPNALNRYMLGSDTPALKKAADGSFTIYIQQESPGPDLESNWLPAPAGPFYLTPRCYAPKPEIIHVLTDPSSWPIPPVVPVS